MNRLALGLMKRVQLFDVVPFSVLEEMTSSWSFSLFLFSHYFLVVFHVLMSVVFKDVKQL